jgi:hypothetical protein
VLPRRPLLLLAVAPAIAAAAPAPRRRGFNLIVAPGHPLGSPGAAEALARLRRTGADTVALIPFFWQATNADPAIVRGADMDDGELEAGIRQARAAGLRVLVKPHVWVPQSWAGAVEMADEAAWRRWFAGYAAAAETAARVAQRAGAEAFSVGTELRLTSGQPEWEGVIARVRAVFGGALTYVAHNAAEAVRVPFWQRLDAIGVSLYPPLGADDDEAAWAAAMRAEADALQALAGRSARPVWIAEIGIRSAVGAAARPWESAEERAAPPDQALQARVLALWWRALDRPGFAAVLVWRWFTDPQAGGPADTDFTVQGKQAERVLAELWRQP